MYNEIFGADVEQDDLGWTVMADGKPSSVVRAEGSLFNSPVNYTDPLGLWTEGPWARELAAEREREAPVHATKMAILTDNGMVIISDPETGKSIKQRRQLALKDVLALRKNLAEVGGLSEDEINEYMIRLYRLEKVAYQNAATKLGTNVPAIRAVAQVETGKYGAFFPSGDPSILFEASKFSSFTGHAYDQAYPSISSRTWNRSLYRGGQAEYTRLNQAKKLNYTAAVASTSWGQFQIMGFNYAQAGYSSPEQMERAMRTTELEHLEAFVNLLNANSPWKRALQQKNWSQFARLYNGPGYQANQYDLRLKAAYKLYGGR